MGLPNQSSKVSRRSRNVPLEWGQWWGSIMDSLTTRLTEKDGIVRIAYGEQIAASNAAAALSALKNDQLKCSNGHMAHYLEFAVCKSYPWRHGGRQYMCRECMKKARIQGVAIDPADEAYLRSKKNNRRKKSKFIETPARTA